MQINPEFPVPNGDTNAWGPKLLTALQEMVDQGNASDVGLVPGRSYKMVAGVIRNPAAAWELIIDDNHRPQNVDSVQTFSNIIRLNYAALNAQRVISFLAAPDEALARAGFLVGASVSKTEAELRFGRARTIADYVAFDGTNWTSSAGHFTGAFAGGVLTLTHEDLLGFGTNALDVAITPRSGAFRAVVNDGSPGTSRTQVGIKFFDAVSGAQITTPTTDLKFYISRGVTQPRPGGSNEINPQLVNEVIWPNSNIWFVGIFEA